jgi:hypothetical protein
VPDGGLLQVCSRRHGALVMNLQSSILMAQMTRSTRSTVCCMAEAGGAKRKAAPSLLKQHRRLHGAWRGQAVPEERLPQGSCYRRHATLHLARRRQAVPARGLLEVSCCRRHASLVMNLQFSILMAQTTDPSSWRRLRDSSHERLLALTPGGEGIALVRGRKRPGQPQQRAEHVDADGVVLQT